MGLTTPAGICGRTRRARRRFGVSYGGVFHVPRVACQPVVAILFFIIVSGCFSWPAALWNAMRKKGSRSPRVDKQPVARERLQLTETDAVPAAVFMLTRITYYDKLLDGTQWIESL